MTNYGAKDLANAFRTVRKNTITIAEEIPEDKYGFQATPQTRTVAQTLVHIAVTPRMPLALHKEQKLNDLAAFDFFAIFGPMAAEEEKPRTKAQILELLKSEGENFASWIETVSDEFLNETVTFPPGMQPPTKTRFDMLMSPKEHEMHHRGQLMVLQRMLGSTPHLTRQMEAMRAQMMAARK
jgi:uncharacterized damage-inducible protein DinB